MMNTFVNRGVYVYYIHYYADLQFNILYYNRSITEITNVLTSISCIYNLKV